MCSPVASSRGGAAAAKRAASGDVDGGVRFLEKCLEVARADGANPAAEGLANHRLGLAHHAAGDFGKAIEYQKEYMRLCTGLGDRAGEGAARQSMAAANQAQGGGQHTRTLTLFTPALGARTVIHQSDGAVETRWPVR